MERTAIEYKGKKVLHAVIMAVLPDDFEGTMSDALRWVADYNDTHKIKKDSECDIVKKSDVYLTDSFYPQIDYILDTPDANIYILGSLSVSTLEKWESMIETENVNTE